MNFRKNTGIYGLIAILLLLIVYIFKLKGDYSSYIAISTNTAPFYIFAIKKLIIPVIVAVALLLRTILAKKEKSN